MQNGYTWSRRCIASGMCGSVPAAVMDYENEVCEPRPDIFFVDTNGYTPETKAFSEALGIELVVSHRISEVRLLARSPTALHQECRITC